MAIVGSRSYPFPEKVRAYVRGLPTDTVLVSGGATGVDSWAEEEWRKLGGTVTIFPAQWDVYGMSAGYIRNREIIKEAERVVAFWDGRSKGTKHSMNLAWRFGKPLEVILDPRKDS